MDARTIRRVLSHKRRASKRCAIGVISAMGLACAGRVTGSSISEMDTNTAKRVREYIEKRARESASTQTVMRREIDLHAGVFETALGQADNARRGVVGKEIQYISRRARREAIYAVDGMLRMTDRMTPEEFQRLGGRGMPRQGIYLLNPMFVKSDWQEYPTVVVTSPAVTEPVIESAAPVESSMSEDIFEPMGDSPGGDDFDINELFSDSELE